MWRKALAKRIAVSVVVAALVVALAAAGPLFAADGRDAEPLETPEYDAEALAVTPSAAEGSVSVDESVSERPGLVLIDNTHTNRVSRADLAPLVNGLTGAGYTVRFHESSSENLGSALSTADAYVVVDPAQEFSDEELVDVREFTNDGGRLLMVGEPNRRAVSGGLFGTSLTTQESALTSLASLYDMSVDTRYLYNLQRNDGNYKHVIAHPTSASELDPEASMTVYTAASVQVRRGTAVLRTTDGTAKSTSGATGRHTVAATRGNVLIVGDKSFIGADRYNVADNEEFVAYVVEFLISGDKVEREPPATNGESDGPATAAAGEADGDGSSTVTIEVA